MIASNDILSAIKGSFSSLWNVKSRGNTIEIITPYATTSAKFVSVFISKQNDEFIISDGAWINSGVYDNSFELNDECFDKIIKHYIESFNIQQINGLGDKIYYYRKTKNQNSIPSLVMDLAVFISNIVSLAEIEYTDKEEKESTTRFKKKVNQYLESFIPKEELDLSGFLDEKQTIKLSAIIKPIPSKLVLINYITGSNPTHFSNSIMKANFIFEMAEKSKYKNHITSRISVIDNISTGYKPEKLASYFGHLYQNTKSTEVKWSEKEKLKKIIAI